MVQEASLRLYTVYRSQNFHPNMKGVVKGELSRLRLNFGYFHSLWPIFRILQKLFCDAFFLNFPGTPKLKAVLKAC